MPGGLLPDDDLYARLEVEVDASPEAIEVAWRALLKRHHPDVAGGDDAALDRAKRINVAHDWLSDPDAPRPLRRGGAGPRARDPRPARERAAPGVQPTRHPGDRDGRRSGAPLVDPGGPRPRRPGGAPRPVPCPGRTPDARRAGPAGRRGAAADRLPRDRPPVPGAGRQDGVRRCRGRARAPRAARSMGAGGPARGTPRRGGRARAGAVPRRPAGASRSADARATACCAHGTRAWTSRATGRTAPVSSPCATAWPR